MTAANAERREHERRIVSLPVHIIHPDIGQATLFTKDLSVSGAFVKLPRDKCPPVGTIVGIRFLGNAPEVADSVVNARVVRVTDEGMGLRFFDFDAF
ncbi:MAG: PilZ domain-containing protein [Pseudomonadota bacterium]|nr:MAG: PilZ domain-containing protein [Pseudomonadota bacterium]